MVTQTKKRIEYIFDNFENISVSVSGGKDSTVLCWLALQEAHRRNRKIIIMFIDEEAVYQSTIEQIDYLMNIYPHNTIKMWFQFPFNLTNATSLLETQLICWDEKRPKLWMRSKKSYAIKDNPWEKVVIGKKQKGFGFYDVIKNYELNQQNTAFLVGLRAAESLDRFRAVCKNPGYKNIYWSTKVCGENNITFYPLYDWNYSDIWKYIYDNKIKYNKIYDYQWKKNLPVSEMRISSLVHEKAFKSLVELPEFEPETFDKLCKRINGISVGNLYGKTEKLLKCRKLPKNYESWIEYRDFLLDTYPDKSKKWIFEKRFSEQMTTEYVAKQQCRQLILNDYENNLPIKNVDDPRKKTVQKWKELL